ncbi:T9SS type A sorting domain-containing protein [Flavobacterium sp. CFBP9031]|uniref:T9SS type A sorting domain-containing protein n=1 Tax=Flavobacterium sp. CFBP9031 TaxID=3096538 RepID=UPI002A6B2585|nr:T9SS type A sorting domain-containing protein [Flavobacterium sp. CFBP9031]MDY0988887.1 T9SS type A sorting domain-containing protein [Flavobacterium sp. CFBP9031]
MKKITFLLLVFVSITSWSQTYKFHTLQDLGSNIEIAISTDCTQNTSSGPTRDFNLRQTSKLEVGKIYKSDLVQGSTSGSHYYKVLYSVDYSLDKGSDIDEPAPFELIPDLCNALSWKYIRPVLLGSNLQEAQNNFCSGQTVNDIRERVNIKTETPLNIGQVYFMDFGKGSNYYLITSSSTEFGDSEYQIDPTNSNTIFNPITFDCQKVDLKAFSIITESGSTALDYTKIQPFSFRISQLSTRIQSATTNIKIYLTKSRNFVNANDFFMDEFSISSASMNQYYDNSSLAGLGTSLVVSSKIADGQYYLTMVVSNTEDFNLLNNIASTSNTLTIKNGALPGTPKPTPTPPTTPVGASDLTIDSSNVIVNSDCSCNSILSDLDGKRHKINYLGGSIRIPSIAIKNVGSVASIQTNLKFYLSKNTTLDTSDFPSKQNAKTIAPINAKESYVMSGGEIFSYDFGNNGTQFKDDWNILMVVDDSKANTESNENNNVTAIPVTFYDPTAPLMATTTIETTQPYSINVYNFDGQKVLTKEVNSKEEEDKSLDILKTGIYIIKSNGETRKVLKK